MLRRRLPLSPLALALLLLIAGSLLGAPAAGKHQHDRVGVYNPDCPLVALAALDRQGGLVVIGASTPLVSATRLVVGAPVEGQIARPAAEVRFRAPPTR